VRIVLYDKKWTFPGSMTKSRVKERIVVKGKSENRLFSLTITVRSYILKSA